MPWSPDDAHLTDEFKKPNHPTFSDQSRYSAPAIAVLLPGAALIAALAPFLRPFRYRRRCAVPRRG